MSDLGGLFSPLVRGASLEHSEFELTIATTPGFLSLAAWFGSSWLGLSRWNALLRHAQVESFHCGEGAGAAVQVQADGEWLGRTPMTVQIVPHAVSLLMPTPTVSLHCARYADT